MRVHWEKLGILGSVYALVGPNCHSPRLTEMLENILQHQKGIPAPFSGETKLNLIIVAFPTPEEKQSAVRCISQAYERRGLSFAPMQGTRLNNEVA
jgi:hypothetical protein